MKKRITAFVMIFAVVTMLLFGTTARAETLCKGNHNFEWYVYLTGEEIFEGTVEIPDGNPLPKYEWALFSRERHGVCVCGQYKYLGRGICRREKWLINYD